MQETIFLKKNGKRWLFAESFIKNPQNLEPDELAKLFIELTDDLAYAQTNFPNSKTTKYLNSLSLKVHRAIYTKKKSQRKSPVRFFTQTYPLIIYESRKKIVYALLFFLLSVTIGVLSGIDDENFVRFVLGDSYVNMTIENIEKGKPLDVYNQDNPTLMFLMIAWNNIKVSFMAYAAGALLSVGTFFILFRNGIMLGVFQYLFYSKGLLFTASMGIWLHGTVEIFSIIVAGGAGITLGNSILFPGTYSRAYSMRQGALKGAKMVLGLIPFFVFAAAIESYITRFSSHSNIINAGIISFSILIIIFYFIIYPIIVNKKTNESANEI